VTEDGGYRLPIGELIELVVDWLLENASPFFDGLTLLIGSVTDALADGLLAVPLPVFALVLVTLAWWRVGWRFAVFTLTSIAVIAGVDLWHDTVQTLALVLSATAFSLAVGLPLGIWAARSDRVDRMLRPILDFMQTMPAFVYLIPAAMLFGLGTVPGTVATIIFSMPPAVRLTSLGIRQVPRELVEAGLAFGCTRGQLLFKVQIPTAAPSIMAGVNQNIMLALSMVVIASMIGAGGLGTVVLSGIQRLDVGLGFEGGIGVVLLAIVLDRITQSFGRYRREGFFAQLKRIVRLGSNKGANE
jgi:glycine betaine/proline transport system permease protein